MLRSAWLWVSRVSFWFWLRLGGYKTWSQIYRVIWEKEFRDVPLKAYDNLDQLSAKLQANAGKWRADSWKQLYDAVSYPGKAQTVFDGVISPEVGFDCDDFAIYITNVLDLSLVLSKLPVAEPRFFTVCWMRGWKGAGHNVCLVKLPDGAYAYMDYGVPRGHEVNPAAVAALVIANYAAGADMIGWAISKRDLTPVEVRRG